MQTPRLPEFPKDLVEHRRRNGIALERVAAATRIGLPYLEAIERGDFRKLPGGVYNVSYIRQYARATGYDEESLLGYYREIASPAEPPFPRPAAALPRSRFQELLHRVGVHRARTEEADGRSPA
jgi:cytoskeletal protein RodZ